MSGIEVWGAIAGIVSTLDIIAKTIERKRVKPSSKKSFLWTYEAARFRQSQICAVLEVLDKNKQRYGKSVEATLHNVDRENITDIWRKIGEAVARSKKVADRLLAVVRKDPVDQRLTEECANELDSHGTMLNTLVGSLNTALQLAESVLPTQADTSPTACSSPTSTQAESDQSSQNSHCLEFIKDPWLEHFVEEDNVDRAESRRATALLLACRHRRKNIVQYCLSLNPDTTLHDDYGLSALHATIGTADIEAEDPMIPDILRLLLDSNADPSLPDASDRGFTPLHRAADTGNLDAVKLLLEYDKTSINAMDKQGKTALWYACSHPNPVMDMIKYLARKRGTFVDHRTPDIHKSHEEIIMSLLREEGAL
ncbi:MAG: hypothetical protein Q9219_006599 [cf. Caloplaca sp. 3 TL-2023]